MDDISRLRRNLLRACYLLLVVGLALTYWPSLFSGPQDLPLMDGVVIALLSAIGLLAVVGLFSPVRMIPLLMFEIAWKAIWFLAVAVPLWINGAIDEAAAETLFAVAFVIPFVFIVPWPYVARTYLAQREPF